MKDTHDLGAFETLQKVWDLYPFGGCPGDFVIVAGVVIQWNDDRRVWGDASDIISTVENQHVEGNLTIDGDLTVGGSTNGDEASFTKLKVESLVVENPPYADKNHNHDSTYAKKKHKHTVSDIEGFDEDGVALPGTIENAKHADVSRDLDEDSPVYDKVLRNDRKEQTDHLFKALGGLIAKGGIETDSITSELVDAVKVLATDVDAAETVSGKNILASEKVAGQNLEATDTVKGNYVEAKEAVKGKNAVISGKTTTLNLLVQQLAEMYDLNVSHVATLFRTIVKDYISSETFIPGFTGEGMKLYKALNGDWNFEVDNLVVRKMMTVFELVISKIRAVNGGLVISPANGKVKSVALSTGTPAYYVLSIEGDMMFVANDLVRCQVFTGTCIRYYWVPVASVNKETILILKSDFPTGVIPAEGDDLVQMGNTTNKARQGLLYLTAAEDGKPRISVLDGVNSTSLVGKNKVILGCLDGMTDMDFPADAQPSGYGLYAMNVFLKGIFILRSGKTIESELSTTNAAAKAAKDIADAAKSLATSANNLLADIASDNKLTPLEKQATKKEWDGIVSEKVKNDTSATKYGVTRTAYNTAYNALSTYIAPLLANLAITSDIVGTTFRSTFKAYYDARTDLLNTISAKAKDLADAAQSKATEAANAASAAQSKANEASAAAGASQTTANDALKGANGANALLSDIANDNKLTAQEKQQTKKEWDVITSEKVKNDASADKYGISKAAYLAAYITLSTYIAPLLVNLSVTSDIVGSTFRANFKGYYDARTDLLNTISAKSKDLADAAQQKANSASTAAADAQRDATAAGTAAGAAQTTASNAATAAATANTLLTDIASDNKLTATEKQQAKKEWDVIMSEKPLNNASAVKFSVTTTAYDAAYNALNTYVAPLLANLITTSDIVGTTFRSTFKTYYDARTNLLNAISEKAKLLADTAQTKANQAASAASTAQTKANEAATAAGTAQSTANSALSNANGANALLSDIANDNKFTPSEKQSTKKEWDAIVSEKPLNDASADKFGVVKTTYGTAYTALSTYITPLLTSLTTTQDIVGTTFRNTFKAYYDARTNLLNAISAKAKSLADEAQAAIDNLQIGGKNLLLDSKVSKSGTLYTVGFWDATRDFVVGEEFTVTIKGNIPGTKLFGIWFNAGSFYAGSLLKVGDGIYSKLIAVPIGTNTRRIGIYLKENTANTDAWSFEWIKLETGNRRTDWTPAPEEIETKITTIETKFEIREGQISAKVTEVTTKATQAATSATNAKASETNASGSAVSAGQKATAAGGSATAAAGSAATAGTKAGEATASAANAKKSADDAAVVLKDVTLKESSITQTAGQIATKVTEVNTKVTEANTSATNAKKSETAASGAATTAGAKAGEAATSASNAKSSADSAAAKLTIITEKESSVIQTAGQIATKVTEVTKKATEASTSATNAKTSETNAGTKAADAKKAADDAAAKLTIITQKESSINQTAGSITLQVTEVTTKASKAAASATAAAGSESAAENSAEIAKAMSNGKMLYRDPSFEKGNNGIAAYNNLGNGVVTVTRVSGIAGNPNGSGYCLKIVTTANASPGWGGWYLSPNVKANQRLVYRFIANIPTGRSLSYARNDAGSGVSEKWLTSTSGTGKWEEYAYVLRCGASGAFSNCGHFYLTGGSTPTVSAPLVWYLAYATVYDTTDAEIDYIADAAGKYTTKTEHSSSITQLSDSIALKVAKTDFNALGNRVSNAETTITQHTGQIALKAAQSDVTALGTRVSAAELKITPDAIKLTVKSQTDSIVSAAVKRTEVWVDATGLDQSKYYPITMALNTAVGTYAISIDRILSTNFGKPSWSTHSEGFSVLCRWTTNACGWGGRAVQRTVLDYTSSFASVVPVGSIGQLTNSSQEYIYVRGGSKYRVTVEGATGVGIILRTSAYTQSDQTVGILTSVTVPVPDIDAVNTRITNVETSFEIREGQISSKVSQATTSATNAKTSETNAATSASTAGTKATAAGNSATSAAGSATTAGTKANESATSATNAKKAADDAAAKLVTITQKETSINQTANSINLKATEVTTKATEAATSANNAAGSASTANSKATSAGASATSAANSATSAAGSATTAGQKATAAANSASDATAKLATITTKETSINQTASQITIQASTVTTKTAEAINAAELAAAMSKGKMLYRDPTFESGLNNTSSYALVGTRVVEAITGCPNRLVKGMRITATGWASASDLRIGGFHFANLSRANAIFVVRIIALIPVGRTIQNYHNLYGVGGVTKWLTPQAGTGKWEEYACKVTCGSTGTFSTINHFALTGGTTPTASAPVTWYLAYATVFDTTDVDDVPTVDEIKAGINVSAGKIGVFGKDISLAGAVTFSSLAGDAQGKIATAQSTADTAKANAATAQAAANSAQTKANKAETDASNALTNSRNNIALKLGYASYADMEAKATAGQTIITGGKIRTSLIDAKAIVTSVLLAEAITATNLTVTGNSKIGGFTVIGNRLVNENLGASISISDSTNSRYVHVGRGSNIVDIASYGSDVTGLYVLSNNPAGTGTNYAIQSYGRHIFGQRIGDVWSAPGALWAGSIGMHGGVEAQWGNGAIISRAERLYGGAYRIYHNLGHLDYYVFVQVTRWASGGDRWMIAYENGRTSSYFDVLTCDKDYGLIDTSFRVAIIGRNKWY